MRTPATSLVELVAAQAGQILAPARARFDALIATVASEFGFKPAELQGVTQAVLPARRAAVVLAIEFLNPPFHRETLASWFGISEATLYRFQNRVREKSEADPAYARQLATLRERLPGVLKQADQKPPQPKNAGD